jgi:fatty acid desaturase
MNKVLLIPAALLLALGALSYASGDGWQILGPCLILGGFLGLAAVAE